MTTAQKKENYKTTHGVYFIDSEGKLNHARMSKDLFEKLLEDLTHE